MEAFVLLLAAGFLATGQASEFAELNYQSYRHQTASVGDVVVLTCHTTLSVSVDWMYFKTNESLPTYVYSNFVLYEKYLNKISDERISPVIGDYDLILLNGQRNDSGWYVCIEDGGFGNKHAIELLVTDISPVNSAGYGWIAGVIIALASIAVITTLAVVKLCSKKRLRQCDKKCKDLNGKAVANKEATGLFDSLHRPNTVNDCEAVEIELLERSNNKHSTSSPENQAEDDQDFIKQSEENENEKTDYCDDNYTEMKICELKRTINQHVVCSTTEIDATAVNVTSTICSPTVAGEVSSTTDRTTSLNFASAEQLDTDDVTDDENHQLQTQSSFRNEELHNSMLASRPISLAADDNDEHVTSQQDLADNLIRDFVLVDPSACDDADVEKPTEIPTNTNKSGKQKNCTVS